MVEKLGRDLGSNEIRRSFLEYFERHGHTVVPSSSLVPYGDPTLMFTNAGMVQFKDVFLGFDTRQYVRAASSQKCVRAGGKHNDLDNVGFTRRHQTFFEMLGNFSFGDYFKEDAIEYAWEFLVDVLELPPGRMWVTIFREDDEAGTLWRKIAGIPSSRIIRMGEADNFWAMGETGPCGPCSEIIVDRGENLRCGPDCNLGECDCDRWLEIWNLVFMQYFRDENGDVIPLPKPSIDTGLGLERIGSVLQGAASNFDTDLFIPIIDKVRQIAGFGKQGPEGVFPARVIADHVRACTFLAADGVRPSNEGRGYVMRRILRRAVRFGKVLGVEKPFLAQLVPVVTSLMGDAYPELKEKEDYIKDTLTRDEERFLTTLEGGQARAQELIADAKKLGHTELPGQAAFLLYDTFGFPIDLTKDIARDAGLSVDEDDFEAALAKQRERSRKARKDSFSDALELHELVSDVPATRFTGYSFLETTARVVAIVGENTRLDELEPGLEGLIVLDETPFYATGGGQEHDTGVLASPGGKQILGTVSRVEKTQYGVVFHRVKAAGPGIIVGQAVCAKVDEIRRQGLKQHHTATHLLHKALRTVLGDEVEQAGSLVGDNRLRFDFRYGKNVLEDDIEQVQYTVNEMIMSDVPVTVYEASLEEAKSKGAIALFGEKYGEKVRVVEISGFSSELCGGTHVLRTGEIGPFIIESESSIAAGVRRIEAVAGKSAILSIRNMMQKLKYASRALETTADEMVEKIHGMKDTIAVLNREIETLKKDRVENVAVSLVGDHRSAVQVGNRLVIVSRQDDMKPEELRRLGDLLKNKGASIAILGSGKGQRAFLTVMVDEDTANTGVDAVAIVRSGAKVLGGSGGGKRHLAQAGGKNVQDMDKALEIAASKAAEILGKS